MKNWIIFFGIIIAGLLAVSGVAYLASQNTDLHKENTKQGEDKEHEENNAQTSEDSSYTINKVPLPSIEDLAPSLDRGIQFSASIPEDARMIMRASAAEIIGRLKNDVTRGSDWLDLALLYHAANDYIGARDVWEFLKKVDPNNFVVVENLAKLYHFNLPNYPKSEGLFREAMALDPSSFSPYDGLFELYRYSYKTETSAAVDILKESLVMFPEETRIYLMIGQYYRDKGNNTQAKQAFLEGLDMARNQNDLQLIEAFGIELDRVQ